MFTLHSIDSRMVVLPKLLNVKIEGIFERAFFRFEMSFIELFELLELKLVAGSYLINLTKPFFIILLMPHFLPVVPLLPFPQLLLHGYLEETYLICLVLS